MKTLKFKTGLFCFVLLQIHNWVLCQPVSSDEALPGVVLERTEVRTLHSENMGQDFELFISLPRSYENTDKNYPLVIVLDPYQAFPIVKGMTDAYSWPSPIIQEVILVGIGYGGGGNEATLNWVVGRTRDLTPVKNSNREEYYENRLKRGGVDIDIETGGAPQFLHFIKEELFPLIESNFRININQRMLTGYSAGGLFGLYALFHEPEMFCKYFIGSPSITSFGDSITFEYERYYANSHADLEADIFMSVGQLEEDNAKSMKKIADLLYSRNYRSLNLETRIFESENHYTCYPVALSKALLELLEITDDK